MLGSSFDAVGNICVVEHATAQHGAFAFADSSGGRLIAVANVPQPRLLHSAFCSGGKRFPVKFERVQAERAGNDGRQAPYNFDKLPGSVFTVVQGRVDERATCFLSSDSLLTSATDLSASLHADSAPCAPEVRRRFASARGRAVTNCWLVARLDAQRFLALVEFARQDRNALASVAFADRDRTTFADYTAQYRGPGQDLWRVDDGGVLSPEGVEIVFLIQRRSFDALGVSWAAGEGRSLAVFVSASDNQLTRVIDDYWYRAPR